MIAAAKKCGCPIKSDSQTCSNFPKDFSSSKETTIQKYISVFDSRNESEKCICPKPNEPGYQKMNGTCDICCEGITENENSKDLEEEESKIVSEIVEKGLPYKEIEAIINNNRMIIRVQKESTTREEWDPSCDCIENTKKTISKQTQNINKVRDDVIFRKVDLNECSQNRTITVYPEPDSQVLQELSSNKNQKGTEIDSRMDIKKNGAPETDKKNPHQQQVIRNIDLEENPNIFLLRIKKRCENGDGKYNIDLEFRTPRPWLPKPVVIKKPPPTPELASEVESEGKKGKGQKGQKVKKGKKRKKGKK